MNLMLIIDNKQLRKKLFSRGGRNEKPFQTHVAKAETSIFISPGSHGGVCSGGEVPDPDGHQLG